MTLHKRMQELGLSGDEAAIASRLSGLGLTIDEITDADLIGLIGSQTKAIAPATPQSPTVKGRQKGKLATGRQTQKERDRVAALAAIGLTEMIEEVQETVSQGKAIAAEIRGAAVAELVDVFESVSPGIQADVLEEVSGRDPGAFRQQLNLWTNSLRTAGGAGEFLARDSAETLA